MFLYAWVRVYSGCLSKVFINIWRGQHTYMQPQEHRKRSIGNTLWSMDLYNHRQIHNNPCAWFERKTFLMKPSRLLEHLQKIHPDKSGKTLALFHSLRDQLLKWKTMNMFTSSSKNSDDGLKASYNISLLIAEKNRFCLQVIKKVLH